jgi:radical SAM superfamily enzyme YgiQ (UPF0313 family)
MEINAEKENSSSVCLVSPSTRTSSRVVPTALLYLSAWLEKEGISVDIIDEKISSDYSLGANQLDEIDNNIVSRLELISPEYTGITCYTSDYNSVVKLAKMIKSRLDTKIVVGGIHPTIKPEDFFFDSSPFDFIVTGEGENVLTELVKRERQGLSVDDIPGLVYERDGKIHKNNNTSFVDLAEMPRPSYEKVDMGFYTVPNRAVLRFLYASGVHIFTTKGCPYACTFCANRRQRIRFRPIEAVIDEIEFLKRNYDIDSFYILDDTFCLKEDRVLQFADGLISRGLNMFWGAETRVNLLTENMVKHMKKAGCIQIDFGVESGSQESLDRMNKGIKVQDTKRVFALCRKYGLRTFANIMFNTPGETEEDVRKTIKLMKEIKATINAVLLTVPLLGTKIYEDYVNPKLTPDEYYLFEENETYKTIRDPRFKLAVHDLDLTRLRTKVLIRFMLIKVFVDLTINKLYWKIVLSSKRRMQYLKQVIHDMFMVQTKRYFGYLLAFLKKYTSRNSSFSGEMQF